MDGDGKEEVQDLKCKLIKISIQSSLILAGKDPTTPHLSNLILE
jgi:hypothetical protein